MTRRHSSVTRAEDHDGHRMRRHHHDRATGARGVAAALLAPEGGAGAELRGHVPAHPDGVALVLHGGSAASRTPMTWWRLAVLRMAPFATAIERETAELADAERILASLDDGSADAAVSPALTRAAEAEEAWRTAVADLAAADHELLAAEEALSAIRARETDRARKKGRPRKGSAWKVIRRGCLKGLR